MNIYRIRSYLREDLRHAEMPVFSFSAARSSTKLAKCVSQGVYLYVSLVVSRFLTVLNFQLSRSTVSVRRQS